MGVEIGFEETRFHNRAMKLPAVTCGENSQGKYNRCSASD
jgi:hypothetical protein